MVTTTHTDDYIGRDLTTPDTDARDYLGRGIMAGDRDFMGRALTGGPEGGGAAALLDEAAVRFDYSEYTDVEDMVDVNGDWGPLTFTTGGGANDILEFNEMGLRLAAEDPENSVDTTAEINSLPGPIVLGPDGITYISVVTLDARLSLVEYIIAIFMKCDSGDMGLPRFFGRWRLFQDGQHDEHYEVTLADRFPPDPNAILEAQITVTDTDPSATGTFIGVFVVDPNAAEVRIRLVSPDETRGESVPFSKPVPDFVADPWPVDYWRSARFFPSGVTLIEDLAWNRAFTPAEVDTLVAHFTA